METQHPRRRPPQKSLSNISFLEKKKVTVKYERSMKAAHSLLNRLFLKHVGVN